MCTDMSHERQGPVTREFRDPRLGYGSIQNKDLTQLTIVLGGHTPRTQAANASRYMDSLLLKGRKSKHKKAQVS